MRPHALTEQLVDDDVCDFMRNGLPDEFVGLQACHRQIVSDHQTSIMVAPNLAGGLSAQVGTDFDIGIAAAVAP